MNVFRPELGKTKISHFVQACVMRFDRVPRATRRTERRSKADFWLLKRLEALSSIIRIMAANIIATIIEIARINSIIIVSFRLYYAQARQRLHKNFHFIVWGSDERLMMFVL